MKFIATCGLIAMAMLSLTTAKHASQGNSDSLEENHHQKRKRRYKTYQRYESADKRQKLSNKKRPSLVREQKPKEIPEEVEVVEESVPEEVTKILIQVIPTLITEEVSAEEVTQLIIEPEEETPLAPETIVDDSGEFPVEEVTQIVIEAPAEESTEIFVEEPIE